MRSVARTLLHPRAPCEQPWKYLLPGAGARVPRRGPPSPCPGDFVLHPDEIVQYLEPAHRLCSSPVIVR